MTYFFLDERSYLGVDKWKELRNSSLKLLYNKAKIGENWISARDYIENYTDLYFSVIFKPELNPTIYDKSTIIWRSLEWEEQPHQVMMYRCCYK